MSETGTMRPTVIRLLSDWDAVPVENHIRPGTPDVEHIHGWIELKWRKNWPKKAADPVILHHPLTEQQKVWITRRVRKGGTVHVLVKVTNEWFLFPPLWACQFLGTVNKAEMVANAIGHWRVGLNGPELKACLLRPITRD